MHSYTRIGVGVIVLRNDLVLLGKRKGAHGNGMWAFPGGNLEFLESPEDCARREVREETALTIDMMQRGPFTHDVFANDNKHYITLFIIAHAPRGTPKICEPNKCEQWKWFAWNDLPKPLFLPIKHLIALGFTPVGRANTPATL